MEENKNINIETENEAEQPVKKSHKDALFIAFLAVLLCVAAGASVKHFVPHYKIADLCNNIGYGIEKAAMNIVKRGSCGENVKWKFKDGTLELYGEGATVRYSSYMYVPWYKAGYDIENVVIGEGITEIGSFAFSNCTDLKEAVLPQSLKYIDMYAFSDCESLLKIDLPENLETIDSYAFAECTALTELHFGSKITSIQASAFSYCPDIGKITVSEDNPFFDSRKGCNAVIEKETNALILGCKNTVIPEGITEISSKAFCGSDLTLTDIPKSVTIIGSGAFFSCKKLKKAAIPEGVEVLPEDVFNECSALTELTLPSTLKEIRTNFAYGDIPLKTVRFRGSSYDFGKITMQKSDFTLLCSLELTFNA